MTATGQPFAGQPFAGQPSEPAASPYPPSAAPRAPGDGECEFCGFVPATQVAFHSLTSIAIVYVMSTRRAWMCRSCGLATYRAMVGRTLLAGWWGVGLFGLPVILLMNAVKLRRVLRLQSPQWRRPEVRASAPTPLDPGRPVLLRGAGIFGTVIGAILLLFILLMVVVSVHPAPH